MDLVPGFFCPVNERLGVIEFQQDTNLWTGSKNRAAQKLYSDEQTDGSSGEQSDRSSILDVRLTRCGDFTSVLIF